ncbi:MAG: hypothetical protein ACKOD2_14620 [Ilumatobacteraceae bacterium]
MDKDRLEMHLRLREVLGDSVGDTVMRSIPPADWPDFARKSDIDHVKSDIDHLAELTEVRFTAVDTRLSGNVAGMWAMGSLMVTLFVAQFTLIITKL